MNPTDVCLYALCASSVMNMHVFVWKFVCSMHAFSCMKFHLPIVLVFFPLTQNPKSSLKTDEKIDWSGKVNIQPFLKVGYFIIFF